MTETSDFWARRKAGVAAEAKAEQAGLEMAGQAQEQAALEDKSDADLLAELNLPDPETLKQGDDFSAFMAKAVPDRLRRRALRRLWRSNPVLANVDMLVDYGEDFTDSATVIENMQTAYQIGKGMLKHVEEMARQAEAAAQAEDVPCSEKEAAEPDTSEQPTPQEAPSDPETLVVAQAEESDADDAQERSMPTPRRMKFRVEESTA